MNLSTEEQLSQHAWKTRENADARKTKVGCALLGSDGKVYTGCNIEHDFCKSFHAEVVALMSMAKNNCKLFTHLLIVAEMKQFTPCGDCLDWIVKYGSREGSFIGFQSAPNAEVTWYILNTLTPFYPIK